MAHELKFHVLVLPTTWEELMARFKHAEDLGFDLVVTGDHFVDWNEPSRPWLEAWTLLAAAARETSRIRIGTYVTQIPFRNPAMLARQALTVDHISGGRLDVGLGTGLVIDPSCEMIGLENWSNKERVARFEEYVEIVEQLLANEVTSFKGQYYQVKEAVMNPRPVQQPRPPIIVAALGPKMMQITARVADIWNSLSFEQSFEAQLAETAERVQKMDGYCAAIERDPSTLKYSYVMFDPQSRASGGAIAYYENPAEFADMARQVIELGFSEIGLYYPIIEEQIPTFEHIARDVIPEPEVAIRWRGMTEALHTDVLIIGAGGAGMSAAIAAAGQGADVLLLDKSLVGRSGATVMAQMTVAAAIGQEEADDWSFHFDDTVAAGRGLVHEPLARLLCREAPNRILEMDRWKVGWARKDGRIVQVHAPGHDRKRCVYVDFLNTGPAVSRTLRAQVNRLDHVRRISDLIVTDLVVDNGRAVGAVALDLASGRAVTLAAKAIIIATGGLTKLFSRNSASANMGGDGYALALRAGAALVDMEFVQFFPIGHLAPRLIGMDPIMWDPFRYKLGGRLLNSAGEEFTQNYGVAEDGRYVIARDVATYSILKEVEAGRGSPHGGVWLSFEHVPADDLAAAFGPVIEHLAANGIDLTKTAIEVAPIAHYHMGGIRVDVDMQSDVSHLFAAGEAVGGANGANRLSGNAISEALVFGERAGRHAAEAAAAGETVPIEAGPALAHLEEGPAGDGSGVSPSAAIAELQQLMQRHVGPFRNAEGLARALGRIEELQQALANMPLGDAQDFNLQRGDWFELRNMLLVAEAIARAALRRSESRGAHQREDAPHMDEAWTLNQVVKMRAGALQLSDQPVLRLEQEKAEAAL